MTELNVCLWTWFSTDFTDMGSWYTSCDGNPHDNFQFECPNCYRQVVERKEPYEIMSNYTNEDVILRRKILRELGPTLHATNNKVLGRELVTVRNIWFKSMQKRCTKLFNSLDVYMDLLEDVIVKRIV